MSVGKNYTAEYLNDPRSTDELLGIALSKDADRDEDAYWKAVAVLQHRLPQILDRIQELGSTSHEKGRDTAATILGQSRVETKFAPQHCAQVLMQMLAQEQFPCVLVSIIFALGHLHDSRAVGPLVKLSSHPDASVRYAVVSSLGGHDDNQATEAMIACSSDQDRDVRNWAVFGLGSLIDTDTSEIREALHARLADEDDEIRGEALVGLARRGDIRVAAALLRELDLHEPDVLRDWNLIADAAEAVVAQAGASGRPEWQPALAKLAALGLGEEAKIKAALNRNMPSQR